MYPDQVLEKKAHKTVSFFSSKLKENGSYGDGIVDISCYFKSPMMFIYAGKNRSANLVLDYIKSEFMEESGDFLTNPTAKSIKLEYQEYWSYTNGWIVRAAQLLGRNDILNSGMKYLSQFFSEKSDGYLANKPDIQNGITDVLTTAHHGLINLEANHIESAVLAGNYLCEAIELQLDIENAFYLRFDGDKKPITIFEKDMAAFMCVDKYADDQLYFMIGYPSAFLAMLYKKTHDRKYLDAAKKYLDFSLSCESNVLSCNFSHKLAWSASIIYSLTGEKKYYDAVKKITQHFVATQSETGVWYENTDTNTVYDQSAEIACWLLDISTNLKELE